LMSPYGRPIAAVQPAGTCVQQQQRLWKLGYKLLKFGLRPSAGGLGTHISLRAERECELGDVVPLGASTMIRRSSAPEVR